MGTRALRQYYDGSITLEVDDALGSVVEPWLRHRRRFAAALGDLTAEQWAAPTRCAGWDTKDVISHLVTVDGFWVVALLGGQAGQPTTYIRGFDPTATPEALVEPMRVQAPEAILESFDAGTATFIGTVQAINDWTAPTESPMGHLPARLVLAHGLWDSWLHERDIFVALGSPPPVEADELFVATWYSLFFAGLQGGLVGDAEAMGSTADDPIDVVLAFDDLPDDPVRVQIDEGVHLSMAPTALGATAAGTALDLVETLTGRDRAAAPCLPADLAAHVARAAATL